MKRVALVAFVVSVAGCGSDDSTQTPSEAQCLAAQRGDTQIVLPGALSLGSLALNWTDCPLHELPSASGSASCADVAMPLRHDGGNDTINVRVKRLLATGAAKGQLWFVSGGPGASATVSHPGFMELFAQRGYDTYTADQRGTGYSARLDCPVQEAPGPERAGRISDAEVAGCAAELVAAHGERLSAYAATYSAVDLAALIQNTREASKPVFVWGGSYGTYLTQRMLRLFPASVDGVILEAINRPDRSSLNFGDGIWSAVEKILGERCASDAFCAGKLGADPVGSYRIAVQQIAAGTHCTDLSPDVDADGLSRLLMALAQSPSTLAWVPAAAYRIARCDPADAVFVKALAKAFNGATPPTGVQWSWPQYNHIILSEMVWDDEFATRDEVAELSNRYAQQPFVVPTAASLLERHDAWRPARYCDPLRTQPWPETQVPMLMLEGALDPLTPALWAKDVGAHYAAPGQTYVEFPHATHGVAQQTPSAGSNNDCGLALWLQFMASPGSALDVSCVAATLPLDFNPPASTLAPSGILDLWENP